MGLDNGIHLITKYQLDLNDWEVKPDYTTISFDEFSTKEYKDGYYYDVCYWRKCWDLRYKIIDILGCSNEGGVYEIDKPSQLEEIQNAIFECLKNPEDWRQYCWSIDEMAGHFGQSIIDLSWLIDYLEKDKTAKVKFYDSY